MNRLALLALLLAAGCTTVGPDYKRPDVPLPQDFSLGEKNEPATIPVDWWKLYGDAKLDELVAAALERNADVRLAAARVLEAQGALREADAAIFPDVSASYGYTGNRVSRFTTPPGTISGFPAVRGVNSALLSTNFEMDFWGKYARGSEAARANLLGSQYARDTVALTLAGTVAQSYFALRSLDAQVEVLGRTIKTRSEALELAKARLQAGLASELDVFQAQSALSDALVQKRDTERQRAIVERQLGQLAGQSGLKVETGDLFKLPVPPTPPAGLPSALLDRRPDIRNAEQGLVAANAQIGVAKAALFPQLNLTAAAGAQSAAFHNLLTTGAGIWTLGFAVALPVFDGGRRSARVDQAEAREQQALANYQKAVETGFREVSEGLINVEQSDATEGDLMKRLDAARSSLDLSNARYEAGYSPFLEVLDAQRTANDAEIAFVRNRQARLAFTVDLMNALGGGWREQRQP
ncbi:MAG: efflux transporter outer membrane subunit [Clostridia bacterium]